MDRFVSSFQNYLDAKARVSIPASVRSVLSSGGFEGLTVHPALDMDAVDRGGHALPRDIDDLLFRHLSYCVDRDLFSSALLGTSEIVTIDPEGRVVLNDTIKARAGITARASFVGQGHTFQIWEPVRCRAYLEEATLRVRDLRAQRGARYAAQTPRPSGARE